MSIETAFHSLRDELARGFKNEGQRKFGAPSERDFRRADLRIDSMSNTELLAALIRHEDQT